MPFALGIKRRIGLSKGLVRLSNTDAIGVLGLTQLKTACNKMAKKNTSRLARKTPSKLNCSSNNHADCASGLSMCKLSKQSCNKNCVIIANIKVDKSIFFQLGISLRAGFTTKSLSVITIKPSGFANGVLNSCIKKRSKNIMVSKLAAVVSKKYSALNIMLNGFPIHHLVFWRARRPFGQLAQWLVWLLNFLSWASLVRLCRL